jgi:ABC-type Mn2+/Zn2+ transport system ATPase subunit
MVSGGIFGPKLSGKSTLAKRLCGEYWRKHKIRSLVLDINEDDDWGEHCWTTADEEKFWVAVWKTRNSIVVVDEAAATIRRDKKLIPVFTRLRHCGHILIVIGHSGMDLLPAMRQQFDTVYLFRQPDSAAKIWAETMTEKGLLKAVELQQYEFIHHQLYGKPRKMKLAL